MWLFPRNLTENRDFGSTMYTRIQNPFVHRSSTEHCRVNLEDAVVRGNCAFMYLSSKLRNSLTHSLNGNSVTNFPATPIIHPRSAIPLSVEGFAMYYSWCYSHRTISLTHLRPRYSGESFVGPAPQPSYFTGLVYGGNTFDCHWCLSNIQRNRAAHALNGNTTKQSISDFYDMSIALNPQLTPPQIGIAYLKKMNCSNGDNAVLAAQHLMSLLAAFDSDCSITRSKLTYMLRRSIGHAQVAKQASEANKLRALSVVAMRLHEIVHQPLHGAQTDRKSVV